MNKHLKDLISLAQFDKEIDALEPDIAAARAPMNHQMLIRENAERKKNEIEQSVTQLTLDIRRHGLEIETQKVALEDTNKKRMEAKSERENKAFEVLEETIKDKISGENDMIALLEKTRAEQEEALEAARARMNEAQAAIDGMKSEIEQKVGEIQKKQEKILEGKDALAKVMDGKVVEFYEKIRKWAGNASVVPVYKQACGGCYILLNDRIYAEVAKQADIITCPHCGRILYIEESTGGAA